jgi:hypothetical protein
MKDLKAVFGSTLKNGWGSGGMAGLVSLLKRVAFSGS